MFASSSGASTSSRMQNGLGCIGRSPSAAPSPSAPSRRPKAAARSAASCPEATPRCRCPIRPDSSSSVRRISPMPPPNSVWNMLPEVRVDRLERFGEPFARFHVDLLDGLLGVADGIEQVLPLRVQEVVALLRFLELFERLRIHRPQRFDLARALPDSAARSRPAPLRRGSSPFASANSATGRFELLAGWSLRDAANQLRRAPVPTWSSERFSWPPAPRCAVALVLLRTPPGAAQSASSSAKRPTPASVSAICGAQFPASGLEFDRCSDSRLSLLDAKPFCLAGQRFAAF